MYRPSLPTLKRELSALTQLNLILNDYIYVMKCGVVRGIQPAAFIVIVRDFLKLVNDNPNLTDVMKHEISHYFRKWTHRTSLLASQYDELQKFADYIACHITSVRGTLLLRGAKP